MKTCKAYISLLLVLALALSMVACGGGVSPEISSPTDFTGTPGGYIPGNAAYHVTIQSQGGMPLKEIGVYIYEDEACTVMVDYGQTDPNGQIEFDLPVRGNYYITLSGVPKGYSADERYTFTNASALITLRSSLITDESMGSTPLKPGDVMYDFTVTTPDGTPITLSELLQEKKMVLLNFWYVGCSWCVEEFPYMQQAYEQYSDDVGIIALNPTDSDSGIKAFQNQYNLSFPMAACPISWTNAFGISGYPTSVMIDRYGVICLIEAGAITSLRPFTTLFEHFIAGNYQQKVFGSLGELVSNVKPTFSMPAPEEISAVLDGGTLDVTYRPETEGEDAEYAWPFILAEKNGASCIKASNQGIEASFAILYIDIYLEAGQAVGLDYLASSEKSCDVLHVIVNDQAVYQISGVDAEENWQTCYPWVALEDGTYEIALCYIKDGDTDEGDDTVYLKNLRILDSNAINAPTYIPRYPAVIDENDTCVYETIVFNEQDGYYHVGTANGPLLLADLMNYSQISDEHTVWEIVFEGIAKKDGENFYDDMVQYFSYSSNSALYGICTVNEELAQWLKLVADNVGFDGHEYEWLKICKYYEPYGTDEQLVDPIKGLANFSAYEAKLGKNIETNSFYYNRPIMPRGLLAKFVPETSGVYRITSRSDSIHGVEGWIFGEDRNVDFYTYMHDERRNDDGLNVSMVYYMEAGNAYYIDIAFWDIYEVGTIYYDIEYVAPTYDLLRLASPSYYTYDSNATGDQMYEIIAGGIDVMLGDDGYYHEIVDIIPSENDKYILGILESFHKDIDATKAYLKGLWGDNYDAKAEEYLIEDVFNGRFHEYVLGSLLYADFTGITGVFNHAIATTPIYGQDGNLLGEIKGMIDLGGFDFSKTENDLYILSVLEKHNFDIQAADAYLRSYWGEEYAANAAEYRLEDVFEGKYHGRGKDYTAEMRSYLSKMIASGDAEGCVVVDARLAELLQLLMDKYTFAGVENSWTKMCYYFDHLGPK